MASLGPQAFLILDQLLGSGSSLNQGLNGNGTTPQNGTAASSAPQNALGMMLSLFFSMSALRDWFKLIVIGGIIETGRRIIFSLYYKILDSFFITAYFEDNDDSYDWMMFWLSRTKAWKRAREVQVSTRTYNVSAAATLVMTEDSDNNGSRKLAYIPTVDMSYSTFYNGRWMGVHRYVKETNYNYKQDCLKISIMTTSHKVLDEILMEARKAYTANQENSISIYVSTSMNDWKHLCTRPKRPLSSIVLEDGVKDLLVNDAKDFLDSKSWYADRGIPFRRGYLLYGAPGCGKTSLITAMAGELGLDVYIISLSRAGMDDTALNTLISDLPEQCIALMEDVDAALNKNLKRDGVDDGTEGSEKNKQENSNNNNGGGNGGESARSNLSLSGLLNALDGVGAQEGRILFATTNRYSALDPALSRPGRMDIHVEFKLASKFQAEELFRRFYLPGSSRKSRDDSSEDSTNADSDSLNNKDETSSVSSTPTAVEGEVPKKPEIEKLTHSAIHGQVHRQRAPKLSLSQIDSLAKQFASTVPEREFSMAALQGYLMTYKIRPLEAVEDASDWVSKEREERAKKSKEKSDKNPEENNDRKEERKEEKTGAERSIKEGFWYKLINANSNLV